MPDSLAEFQEFSPEPIRLDPGIIDSDEKARAVGLFRLQEPVTGFFQINAEHSFGSHPTYSFLTQHGVQLVNSSGNISTYEPLIDKGDPYGKIHGLMEIERDSEGNTLSYKLFHPDTNFEIKGKLNGKQLPEFPGRTVAIKFVPDMVAIIPGETKFHKYNLPDSGLWPEKKSVVQIPTEKKQRNVKKLEPETIESMKMYGYEPISLGNFDFETMLKNANFRKKYGRVVARHTPPYYTRGIEVGIRPEHPYVLGEGTSIGNKYEREFNHTLSNQQLELLNGSTFSKLTHASQIEGAKNIAVSELELVAILWTLHEKNGEAALDRAWGSSVGPRIEESRYTDPITGRFSHFARILTSDPKMEHRTSQETLVPSIIGAS